MSDKYVGVGGELHDSNVAVLDESGNIVLAINEERLTRTKKEGRFPFCGIKATKYHDAKVVIGANSIDEAVSQVILNIQKLATPLHECRGIYANLN
ncbi:MAG: carbamoyltransferase N-terminal domain-containing protein [Candidatus Woesearchaeota archaeon]